MADEFTHDTTSRAPRRATPRQRWTRHSGLDQGVEHEEEAMECLCALLACFMEEDGGGGGGDLKRTSGRFASALDMRRGRPSQLGDAGNLDHVGRDMLDWNTTRRWFLDPIVANIVGLTC